MNNSLSSNFQIENINMAVDECKSKLIKPELDGEFCRAWLLTEWVLCLVSSGVARKLR